MPTTRRKTLFVVVPFVTLLGVFSVADEVAAHGLGAAVVAGLLGGACASAAMAALAAARWGPRSAEEKALSRRAWQRTHSSAVAIGLLGAGIISTIGAVAGDSVRGLGEFAMTGIGVVFVGGAVIVALMAIKLPQLWE